MKKTVPLLLIIALFGAAGWYFFTAKPAAVHEQPPPPIAAVEKPAPEQPPPAATEPAPVDEAAPEEALPELKVSDKPVEMALDDIAGDASPSAYIVKDHVISRAVAAIDSLTGRQVPRGINPLRPVGGSFKTEKEGDRIVLSPDNFKRYDGYVATLQQLDSSKLADLYHRYYPLIQQAWTANGGEGDFNQRLLVVIDSLLQTPEVTGPVYLNKPEAVYLFADPQLEALTAGQKILIRMGSANAAIVKSKLAQLSRDLAEDEGQP